jgi:hypothetical protein
MDSTVPLCHVLTNSRRNGHGSDALSGVGEADTLQATSWGGEHLLCTSGELCVRCNVFAVHFHVLTTRLHSTCAPSFGPFSNIPSLVPLLALLAEPRGPRRVSHGKTSRALRCVLALVPSPVLASTHHACPLSMLAVCYILLLFYSSFFFALEMPCETKKVTLPT